MDGLGALVSLFTLRPAVAVECQKTGFNWAVRGHSQLSGRVKDCKASMSVFFRHSSHKINGP